MKTICGAVAALLLADIASAQDAGQLVARRAAAECIDAAAVGKVNADAPKAPNDVINRLCWCIGNTIVSKMTAAEIRAQLDGVSVLLDGDPRMQATVDECSGYHPRR